MEAKYLMTKEKNAHLEKELKLIEETRAGFQINVLILSLIRMTKSISKENQSKNIRKNDSEKLAAPPKNIVDAVIQTDVIEKKVESCQTESPERMDFQVQVHMQEQSEPIATQTDSTVQCDFQVQANIPLESDSIAVQTIKEEIRMPNIPSSVAQTPAKKRKLSSKTTSGHLNNSDAIPTTNLASINVPAPVQPIPNEQANTESVDDSSARQDSPASQLTSNGSENELRNEQANIDASVDDSRPLQSISNQAGGQDNIEDSILNSEVYKTYCRERDPKEAMKKIKELKGFISFHESWREPNERELNRMRHVPKYSEQALETKTKVRV